MYAGIKFDDRQAAGLIYVSRSIGTKLSEVMQRAKVVIGPDYGLRMTMRERGPIGDSTVLALLWQKCIFRIFKSRLD